MRILLVSEDLPAANLAGAGRHTVLLGNALIESGHQVEILGRVRTAGVDTNHGFLGPLHPRIDLSRTGWKEHRLGVFLPMRRLHMAQRIWSAIRHLGGDWDVIHYHGHLPMLGALIPANINFVHTLHDQGAECITKVRYRNDAPCAQLNPAACAGCATGSQPNPIQTAVSAYTVRQYRALAAKAFTRHQAICVSAFIEKRLRDALIEHPALRTSVVHNFIDPGSVCRATANTMSSTEKSLPKSIATVFMAGRIDQSKGFRALLDTIPAARLAEIKIRVAGDGPDLANLRERYGPLGVEFLGWRTHDAVLAEACMADACAVPSICEEACATIVLEALSLGKPVFALQRGGTPELRRYERFPGQLQLLPDIASLADALLSGTLASKQQPDRLGRGDLAAVRYRLPEILDIYRKGFSTQNAVERTR